MKSASVDERVAAGIETNNGHPNADDEPVSADEQPNLAVTIGCVCDLTGNVARFYLDNERFVDYADRGGHQAFIWSVPNIRTCHPFASAIGIPVQFEFVPDWQPPSDDPTA
jgi:hypothetical protein